MYMPNLDDKFGNASNHKRARIIERECDFLEAAKNSLLNDIQSSAWTENSSVFSLIRVSLFHLAPLTLNYFVFRT